MYITVNELSHCTIRGSDGNAGAVSDLLFDDRAWRARYVVADAGTWLHRHAVLLTPPVLKEVRPADHVLQVSLTGDEIEHHPGIDADPPVSVRMEQKLHDIISLASCWVAGFGEPAAMHPMTMLPAMPSRWDEAGEPQTGDPHLRSAAHVRGHHVMAVDGPIGSVEDFVIDDDGWRITDLVVQTHGWPHRRSVLVAPGCVSRISWATRTVYLLWPRERIDGRRSVRCA